MFIDLICANAVMYRPNRLLSNFLKNWTAGLIIHDPNTPELYPEIDA